LPSRRRSTLFPYTTLFRARAFQGSHPLPALAGMLGWSRPDSCWARAKSGGSECFGPVRSMIVTRHPVPDAAIPGGEFETGAAPQRVDVCAVELLPRRLADRRGGRRLATATLDFFLGDQRVAASGVEVDAYPVPRPQPRQAAARRA